MTALITELRAGEGYVMTRISGGVIYFQLIQHTLVAGTSRRSATAVTFNSSRRTLHLIWEAVLDTNCRFAQQHTPPPRVQFARIGFSDNTHAAENDNTRRPLTHNTRAIKRHQGPEPRVRELVERTEVAAPVAAGVCSRLPLLCRTPPPPTPPPPPCLPHSSFSSPSSPTTATTLLPYLSPPPPPPPPPLPPPPPPPPYTCLTLLPPSSSYPTNVTLSASLFFLLLHHHHSPCMPPLHTTTSITPSAPSTPHPLLPSQHWRPHLPTSTLPLPALPLSFLVSTFLPSNLPSSLLQIPSSLSSFSSPPPLLVIIPSPSLLPSPPHLPLPSPPLLPPFPLPY
ncbi:hypothetical protein Pcinc_028684 [Petrolisthes cinctipes]|uniref:Uncharacterized protein n=1 Tax=Petrolisthes cinctipes TaxID=88211 RepID=A0AAE1K8J1_PETCI|nr:hypothetical protein Pcinc_028684 [Petrolisthes cinctipes]